ncbi:MAG: metallophosphoesterase [Synergistaceae bacterium]|nr:metallophosphoesterase [Synergistaceae bacterium]
MIPYTLIAFIFANLYLYWKLRSSFGKGAWNWVYLPWAVGGTVAPFVSKMKLVGTGRLSEAVSFFSFTWMAVVGMTCLGIFFADTLSVTARFVDRTWGTEWRSLFLPRRCVPVALVLATALVLYSFYEAWNIRRVDLTFETPKLPEGIQRLRLVHLTDVHIGGVLALGRFRKVMDIVRSAEPDLLVITGDLLDGNANLFRNEAELLSTHGARFGAFAVTGNHEFHLGVARAEDFIRRAGVTLLRDAQTDVAGITLVGLDDPEKFGKGVFEIPRLPEGLTFPEDKFVLLLKHRPGVLPETAGKFDLQLSGHTHGGQIWPYHYAVRWFYGHVQGLSYKGAKGAKGAGAVYVGNGTGGPPLRFLAPPEVTVIDLVRKSGSIKK